MVTTLDNTEDPTDSYQTTIFPVATFTPRNTTFRFSIPSGGISHGLHSLILIPQSENCYFELFKVYNFIQMVAGKEEQYGGTVD